MARRRKGESSEEFSLSNMLGLLATGIGNPKPNHYQYKPHDKQVKFHQSEANGRQLLGGNRSGKTAAGINEDIMWALGKHPYLRLPPPPIIGRIVTVDFKNGASKIILPGLRQWLPPSTLINGSWEDSYNGTINILTLANGSEIEIMSHEQDLDKFAGVPRHWIHFDEEPPQDIFKECKARLVDFNGRWWMTMTPVEGMTWTHEEIYEKRDSELIEVIGIHQDENPYLNEEGRKTLQGGYDEQENKVRAAGEYVALSGLVFKEFKPEIHVLETDPYQIKPVLPSPSWKHYRSMDHGFNNPTAIYWHAVDEKNDVVITYREHYKREWTIQQHAEFLKEDEKFLRDNYGILPYLSIADPAIKQRSAVTGLSVQIEYANHGINWALGATKDVNAGLDKMNNYLRLGKWFITADCPNLIKEMRKYARADYATSKLKDKNNKKEEPKKKDDHGCDSTRYFFSFQPQLAYDAPTPAVIVRPNLLGAPTRVLRPGGRFDENFTKDVQKIHIVTDEYVGEW